jgi:outer membrane biosynthesis protein TonB
VRSDWVISGIGHVAVLVCAVVSIAYSKPSEDLSQFMPVTIVTADVSKATRGQQDAPKLKVDDIKPQADKIDAPKPVDEVAPKVVDKKPEIKTETAAKQQPKQDPKPDPKPADKPAKAPDYKPDQIAQILKKDAANKPPKPDTKPQQQPDAAAQNTAKFDANQVAQLLDKRAPQRQMAAADTLSNQPNLGSSNGAAAQLSQSEIDALRARISSCWSPPPGINAESKVIVSLRILLKPDGSLSAQPALVEATPSPLGPPLADSARRAILACQPFTMLKPEHYEQWKDLQLDFNPQILLGG